MTTSPTTKEQLTEWAQSLSDEALFDTLREQVNLSRNTGVHNRAKTRAVAAEAERRGWNARRKGKASS